MDSIKTIAGLAAHLGQPESSLQIHCNFCKRQLCSAEKVIFSAYNFRLRWKEGKVYACCRTCMRLSSTLEFTGYFENNIQVQDLARTGLSLRAHQIRCRTCLKPLSDREKRRLSGTREFIYLVRGQLRGVCTLCRLSNHAV